MLTRFLAAAAIATALLLVSIGGGSWLTKNARSLFGQGPSALLAQRVPSSGPTVVSATDRKRCSGLSATDRAATPPAYWPLGTFAASSSDDLLLQSWYSTQLCAMGELPLWHTVRTGGRAVRFIWLRSFHPGLAVRVFEDSAGYRILAIQLSGTGGGAAGKVTVWKIRQLSTVEWSGVLDQLNAINFWELDTSDRSNIGVDGAEWIVEAIDGARYHVVDRWDAREVASLGRHLLDLSSLNPDPIY